MDENDIAAVRRVRHEISAECNHDVSQYFAYLRLVEEDLKQSGEFRFARTSVSVAPPLSSADLTGIAEQAFLQIDRDEPHHS